MASSTRGWSRTKGWLAPLLVIVALLAAYAFRYILLAGVIGIGLGVVLVPVVRWLHRRLRLPHGLSVLVTALLLLAVGAGLVWSVAALLSDQVRQLVEQGPAMLSTLQTRVSEWLQRFSHFDLTQVDWMGLVQSSGAMIVGGAKTGAEVLGALVVVLAIAIFTAANPEGYLKGFASLFPPSGRTEVEQLGHGSARVIRRWLGSQLIVVLISGVLTAVVMGLLGMDYWLLVALLTVVLDFVPLFGALLTGTVAVMLTLATEPEKVLWVLLAFVAIQQIETDVTLPLVMKDRIRLPEVPLILFVLVFGTAFGVAGIFVAPPLFAVVHHCYQRAYLPRIEGRRPGG